MAGQQVFEVFYFFEKFFRFYLTDGFEQLGIDRLFVDKAESFKNLFLYTKMRNVAGLSQTEAQKSSDLFMKCRYLDDITNGKGVIFSTGTPEHTL